MFVGKKNYGLLYHDKQDYYSVIEDEGLISAGNTRDEAIMFLAQLGLSFAQRKLLYQWSHRNPNKVVR